MEKKIEYVEKLLTQRLSATKELNNIRHRKRVSKLIKEIQELREKLELSKE
jgi:prophage maintenance system killer protein